MKDVTKSDKSAIYTDFISVFQNNGRMTPKGFRNQQVFPEDKGKGVKNDFKGVASLLQFVNLL